MNPSIYQRLVHSKKDGKKCFAVLIDPDKIPLHQIEDTAARAMEAEVDYIFVGGSLVVADTLSYVVQSLKRSCDIPIILFPGSTHQICTHADAILYLSLISGRNAELLIGKHVITAPLLKQSSLEVISTGYMLIDGGAATTASYMSGTQAIPREKDDIAMCTALAGEYLGMKMIYMDAGSGAKKSITESMISTVSKQIDIPLIVGGGIHTPEKALANVRAGADLIVVGNALERNPALMNEISHAIHSLNRKTVIA